jgi:cytidine deaminase
MVQSLTMDWESLAAAALAAREWAYAPYSGYRVGAALALDDGEVITGSNVENRLPALAVCAERVAVCRAVAGGFTGFQALVVATASSPPAPPCGLCLETLAEFVADLPILLVNPEGEHEEVSLTQLLPHRFNLPSH